MEQVDRVAILSDLLCNDRSYCGVSLQEEEHSSSSLTQTLVMETQQQLIRVTREKKTCLQSQNGAKGLSEGQPSGHCCLMSTFRPLRTSPMTPMQTRATTHHSFGAG